MNGIYTYQSSNSAFTVSQQQLAEFSKRFPETTAFRNRIGEFFWFNLHALEKDQGVDPTDVLREVIALEQGKPTFRTPTPFRRKPLKGLMHMHWFSARFMPHNIVSELGPDGVMNAAQAFFPNGIVEADAIRGFADAITYAPFEQREARGGLTGEWIIYAAEDQNYYLCCCGHKSADHIHKEIIRHARRDFPRLKWFNENRELLAQVIAEDLDALLRSGKVKTLNVPSTNRDMNELLCSLDYDNLDKYCEEFLGFLLCSLLTLDEIHLLDRFAMQTPQERLLAELKRRGLRADVGLNELMAAIKLTLPPLNRQPNRR
ncbi:MAG: hypothetical protein JO170_17775 [Verrucomicrobia bacterium]|nr:hypothetical protein [Verrucomicrobiota bacterium]